MTHTRCVNRQLSHIAVCECVRVCVYVLAGRLTRCMLTDNMRTSRPFPFSIKPDKPVTIQDVMAIMGDSLEGTPFDMTKGVAAGAFGSPDRYMPGPGEQAVAGNWERPIALFRTSDSYVIQSRKSVPSCLFVCVSLSVRVWMCRQMI